MRRKKGPQYNTEIFSDETRQCALEGCEGVWYLRTRSGPDNKKFCSVDCCRRWHQLKGKKILVVECKNPDCQKSFPTLHPDIRRAKKATLFYDYCSRECSREAGPGATTHGTAKLTDQNTSGEVVNFAMLLRSEVPLSPERVNRACDAFIDKRALFSTKPPHLRYKRDDEQTYIRAIDTARRGLNVSKSRVGDESVDARRHRCG